MSCSFLGVLPEPCNGPSDLTGRSIFWFEIHDTLGNNLLDFRNPRYDLNKTYLEVLTAKGFTLHVPVVSPGKFKFAFYDWDEESLVPFGKLTTHTYYVHFSDGDVDTIKYEIIMDKNNCNYLFSYYKVSYNGIAHTTSSPHFVKL